jgi:hypothetical protein
MRDGAVANVNGKLRSEEKVLVSNLPGRQIIIEVPRENAAISMRFFLLDNAFIEVSAYGRFPPGSVSLRQSSRLRRR